MSYEPSPYKAFGSGAEVFELRRRKKVKPDLMVLPTQREVSRHNKKGYRPKQCAVPLCARLVRMGEKLCPLHQL